jgi:dipeptidyl aminopeptidase/acylaminoacyl peptidase
MRASNGSGEDVPLVKVATGINITSPDWSRNGIIVYANNSTDSGTGYDLWTLSVSGDRTPTVFLKTKHNEAGGTFSPDGRWIAYHSNASDRNEVYVRPFPARDPMQKISRDGGDAPRWRRDGKELFFRSLDGTIMAAGIDATTKGLTAGAPHPLFRTQLGGPGNYRPYAVARDGQRFLIPIASPEPLRVVLDWRALLAK